MAVRKRLGEMLLEAGVIDQNQLDAALGHQRKWGGRLGQALVDLKMTSEASVVEALSQKFGYEVVSLEAMEGGPVLEAALRLVPREVALRHNVLPYSADTSTVSVAMSDPGNIAVVDEIRFRAGRRVKVALAGDREIASAVRRFYFAGEKEPASVSLELEDDASSGETVVEQFGGGSSDALDQFFASPPGSGAAPAATRPAPAGSAPEAAPAVPESVELEDFLTPSPAPLRAVEAVARAQAPAAANPTSAQAATPAKSGKGAGSAPAGPGTATPAGKAASQAAPRKAAAPAQAASPAEPVATAEAASGPTEEPAEKSGTLELPLDAEIPPDGAPDDLWSQGPFQAKTALAEAATPRARPRSAEREVEILGAIEELAQGEPVPPELVKPSQLAAALLRLLIRKKLVSFEEFLEEFGRK